MTAKKTPSKQTRTQTAADDVGVSLGARLRAFLDVFATRRDVHVVLLLDRRDE